MLCAAHGGSTGPSTHHAIGLDPLATPDTTGSMTAKSRPIPPIPTTAQPHSPGNIASH